MATSEYGEEGGDEESVVLPSTVSGSWLTPLRMLVLFCTLNILIYMDRGVISSNGVSGTAGTPGEPGSGIMGAFGLTLFQAGLLPAAFMVGLLVASPAFAEASKQWHALRLIALGLTVWLLAAAASGAAWGFYSLLAARMVVGVGEASFVALAAPFIDDVAPPARKSSWLAAFYLCIPAGVALGYIFGGLLAAGLGWRAPFLLEAALALPLVALLASLPPLDLRGSHSAAGQPGADSLLSSLKADALALARLPVYVLVVAGMTCFTALLGALSYYGPRAGREVFDIPAPTADVTFGGVTVFTGIVGTLIGGVALDGMGSSIHNALLLCAAGLAAGCLLLIGAFALASNFVAFMAVLALGQMCLFATMAPSNAVVLWTVPPGLRAPAMSFSVVALHVLGDVPSPPALGFLQGRLRDWRLSLSLASLLLAAGAACYALATAPARSATDYRAQDAATRPPLEVQDLRDASLADSTAGAGVGGVEGMRLRLLAGQSTPNLAMLRELEENRE
ncbi:hypothetical protein ACKKBG_A03445 [Auxenochlorella protothecoides x Auxenochlorella symbiontica]|uniref:Major facilitator superfamily (MFS) profile domain-containing protein n=2 Tax=Auxenochlorella protothecoides TaxID=3075 RepID=A0A1D1ZS98_AUXPR